MEPYKIKTIEPIAFTTREERLKILKGAKFNIFRVPASGVTIDFLSDSGTGAMSQDQWAELMRADESYAVAKSWERFNESVKTFTGMPEVIPVHQGRAAEKIIAEVLFKPGESIIANGFFDTTGANLKHKQIKCVTLPHPENADTESKYPYKGDIDLKKTERKIKALKKSKTQKIRAILLTLTNNGGGGQPASLENIKAAKKLALEHKLLFIIDSCRIAEQAFLIKKTANDKRSIKEIIKEIYSLADLTFMSAKKDGLANIGGFIAMRDQESADKLRELLILYEGYITYGGLSGRDLEAIAQGLKEVTDEKYLAHRVGQIEYLHQQLAQIGIPLLWPAGGHAVYINAGKFLPNIRKNRFPAKALEIAFYLEGGIRTVELGSLMFGENTAHELLRLAIPRRVYTQNHLDYVVQTAAQIKKNARQIKGVKIIKEPKTKGIRHFMGEFALI